MYGGGQSQSLRRGIAVDGGCMHLGRGVGQMSDRQGPERRIQDSLSTGIFVLFLAPAALAIGL